MTQQSFSNDISTTAKKIVQLSSQGLAKSIGATEGNRDFEIKYRPLNDKIEAEETEYSLFDYVSFD